MKCPTLNIQREILYPPAAESVMQREKFDQIIPTSVYVSLSLQGGEAGNTAVDDCLLLWSCRPEFSQQDLPTPLPTLITSEMTMMMMSGEQLMILRTTMQLFTGLVENPPSTWIHIVSWISLKNAAESRLPDVVAECRPKWHFRGVYRSDSKGNAYPSGTLGQV